MAPNERRPSLGRTPPPGSRLEAYVRHFEEGAAEGPPLWENEDPAIREAGAVFLILSTPRHELPFAVVRDFIVIPMLIERGMPDGDRPEWHDHLIDAYAEQLQNAFADEAKRAARLPSKRKGGHPQPKAWIRTVVFAAYTDELQKAGGNATDNACFQRVAARLGGGSKASKIDRGFVRRIVRAERQVLGGLRDEKYGEIRLVAALCIAGFMAEFDREHPPKRGRGPQSASPVRFSRTGERIMLGGS